MASFYSSRDASPSRTIQISVFLKIFLAKLPMDCHFLFLLLGFGLCLLPSLASQTPGLEGRLTAHLDGVFKHPTSGKRLSLQARELESVKVQAEKERETNENANQQDSTAVTSETGASLGAQLPAGTGDDNISKVDMRPGNEEARSPLPSIDKKDETSEAGNNTDVDKPAPNMEEFGGHLGDNDTNSETSSKKERKDCGGSHCKDPKTLISACLSIPGDGPHKLSLFITYEGDTSVLVKVIAPEFLIADPLEVSVSKGKSETIHFTMDPNYEMDSKSMGNKTIVVTSDCEIEVPMEYLSDERAPILPSVEPRVIAYLLVFVFIVSCVSAWFCYKCRGKKRVGEVKYQQLEMNGAGQSTPKERVEEAVGSWEEVWEEDWEDTEAAKSSSRLSQSLSSRGLAARRGAKDGWDNSWED
ncbi:hypothetical protein GOP47_0007508 [Adiantum capillus-veneris]|uniref:DUF7356 domain-containing protein n=1 Tax=Adiantum capillus-veneris TaxID=13818 RepID=A0A9D4V0Z9_ADICA|nr:hypothetical protein GOP47_0007508 [Adiantum capillus-veneris]